ncbi:MAG TPA: 5'-nucleotidase C-terminal domain-containing protein [Gemmatimonadaceae bacterium]|nr:5'-nucleotidase C-terminal domain-containing protein [Gemmatimonadaceae bacterium]
MIRRALSIASAIAITACARPSTVVVPVPVPAPAAPIVPTETALRFLLINDVYFGDTLRDGSAGLARVAALRDSLARTGPVTFVLAGDFLSPSLLSKWYRGEQMREQLNAAKVDLVTFGNHEFELDRDTLIARIAGSRFKWTSANCMLASGEPFPGVSRWDTSTVSGVKVGVFGVTLIGDYRRYVKCSNPDSAAHAAIAALKVAGAQVVYGLTHQTLESDSALLSREPDLDFILGGHEHEFHRVLVGAKRLLKADANSRSAQLFTIAHTPNGWTQGDRLIRIDKSLPFDRATQAVVKSWQDSLVKRLGAERVIATTAFALDGRDATNRSQESPLGDVVTDAIRLGTGADAAIMNSGTMRIDDVLPPGPLTNYQLESIFLFPDETRIMVFPITGARLREILERGVSEGAVGKGAYLQVSGLRYSWDKTKPSGSRIVGDIMKADGKVIRPGDTIRLAFNVYPACEGGDGYTVPEAKPACDARASAPRAVDLVMKHIVTTLGGRIAPPPAGRVNRL